MLLENLTVSGFKSFRKRTELPISSRTTVLLGPNDHGKTNALVAIQRLEPGKAFESRDLNDQLKNSDEAYLGFTLIMALTK